MDNTAAQQEQSKKEIADFTALLKSEFARSAAGKGKSLEAFEQQATAEEYNKFLGKAFARAARKFYRSLGYDPFEEIPYNSPKFSSKPLPAKYDESGVIAILSDRNEGTFDVRLHGGKNYPFSEKSVVAAFKFKLPQPKLDALLGRLADDSALFDRCEKGFLDLRVFDLCQELNIKVLPTCHEDISEAVFWQTLKRKEEEMFQDETAVKALAPFVLLASTGLMENNFASFLEIRGFNLKTVIEEQLNQKDFDSLDTIAELLEKPLSEGIPDSGADLRQLAEAEYPALSDAGIFSECGTIAMPARRPRYHDESRDEYLKKMRRETIEDLADIYEKARRIAANRLTAEDARLPELDETKPQFILHKDGSVIFDENFSGIVLKPTGHEGETKTVQPTFYEHDYAKRKLNAYFGQFVYIYGVPEVYFFDRNSLARALSAKISQITAMCCLWQIATRLVISGAFAPQPYYIEKNDSYAIRWIPDVRIKAVRELCARTGYALQRLQKETGTAMFALSDEFPADQKTDPAQAAVTIFSKFIQSYLFSAVVGKSRNKIRPEYFFYFTQSYFGKADRFWYYGAVFDMLKPFVKVNKGIRYVLLLEAATPEERGPKSDYLTPDAQNDETAPADPLFSVTLALRNLGQEEAGDQDADETPPVITYAEIMNDDRFAAFRLQASLKQQNLDTVLPGMISKDCPRSLMPLSELSEKIITAADDIRNLGFEIIMPRELKHLIRPVTRLSLGLKSPWYDSQGFLDLERLLAFDWQIALGNRKISREDFDSLLKKAGKVVKFAGQYVYLSKEDAEQILKRLKAKPPRASGARLIGVALSGRYGDENVLVSQELKDSIAALLKDQDLEVPREIKAVLRPYQVRGFRWLARNMLISMGSILADDMGLGKTLQLITALQYLKNKGELKKEKALIVVPTAVIINWSREIARFAPDLSCNLFYGQNTDLKLIASHDVTVTTYGTLRIHETELSAITFRTVVLDEAQAIKNTASQVFKAATSLKGRAMVAMTGTPVENRLLEYWAIMDFANPGLLGPQNTFKKEIAAPIEQKRDPEKLGLFRAVTAPFIMRRLKTDKNVIADLPDKTVTDQFCELTPEQAALYESVVDGGLMAVSKAADKFTRGSMVLNMILKLKQICNAPEQFSEGSAHKGAGFSGKAEALFEILDQLGESGRKCLIFTQFKVMGDILVDWISKQTGRKPQFIHGGVPVKKRTEIVDSFQTSPDERVLVLSLKAAGTGLNLTAATAVIHYDLWWNPAVEEQATDRTYRIGQRKDVQVFRFICANTFEERINEIIASKRELSDLTVVTGESWIGSLDDNELSRIFRLTK